MKSEQLESAKKLFFILLGVDIAVTAIVGLNAFSTVGTLRDIQSGARTVDQSLLGSLEFWDGFSKLIFLTMIGVGLGLVKWLNSCYRFAKESLGASGFKNESWTAAGWIIPILNLFRPYQVINEIYKAGAPSYSAPDGWKKEGSSGLLLTWWIFWAVIHFVGWIMTKQLLRSSLRDDISLQQGIVLTEMQAWSCVISLIVAGLWFVVANHLTQRLLDRPSLLSSSLPGKSVGPTVGSAPATRQTSTYSTITTSPVSVALPVQPPSGAVSAGEPIVVTPTESLVVDEDAIYAAIATELKTGATNEGLWTRLFAECDGDENRTRVAYIKQRAERLIAVERARAAAQSLAQEDSARSQILQQREEAMRAAARSLRVERITLEKIHSLAVQHSRNPRMPIDEKAQLLRLTGGSFAWIGGKCSATFPVLGHEKQFNSGAEFSCWFRDEVVPYLLFIDKPTEVADG
jgi:hypothetical protein